MSEAYQKITIFGPPGSGKTTLGVRLAKSLDLPIFHLDKILWDKFWVLRPRKDFLKDYAQILRAKRWIIEGTARSVLEERYQKSDLVIFLNPGRTVCLFRVFKRFFFTRTQPLDKPDGCEEKISWDFLKYLWNFDKYGAPQIESLQKRYPHVKLKTVNSQKYLEQLEKELTLREFTR